MSSFVYGLVTSKRMAAPAGQSQKDAAPAMTTYVDTLAALVPAEALALYSAVVIPNATKTVSVHGKAETVISSPGLLGWSCGGLMLLSGALYLAGRYKSAKLTHWDIVRFLIPPTALAAWMLVQNPGVFNIWWPGSAIGERVVIAAFGAVILGILAKSLGYQADMAQAEPRASVPAQAVPAHAEPADAVAAHAEPADAVAAHAEPADAVAAHAEPAGQQVIDHGPQTVLMIDTTHGSVSHIPAGTPKVGGYTTGTPGVEWTAADWAQFPDAGHNRIDQSDGGLDPLGSDTIDVEGGAATPEQVAGWVKTRIEHNIQWSTCYGGHDALAAVQAALEAAGANGWYYGHVNCWLADWNLDQAQATALIGTDISGMSCVAVQWASPTSNPTTTVPGSALNLAQANVDLSVALASWRPAPHQPPSPQPPAPHPAWPAQALALARQLDGVLEAHQ
jgi:hypothetical protein